MPNIKMNPPQVYMCSPSRTPLPSPSLWVVPVHQPQASSIVRRTWTGRKVKFLMYTKMWRKMHTAIFATESLFYGMYFIYVLLMFVIYEVCVYTYTKVVHNIHMYICIHIHYLHNIYSCIICTYYR